MFSASTTTFLLIIIIIIIMVAITLMNGLFQRIELIQCSLVQSILLLILPFTELLIYIDQV